MARHASACCRTTRVAGILSLGHAAFFALGGYAMGMYLMRQIGTRGSDGNAILPDFMVFLNWKELPWFWHGFDNPGFAILMVLLVPGLLALVFGWLAFRSRVSGVYLSIITQALTYALQGRDIFPLLTVRENLETGFAVLPRRERKIPDEMFELFPILKTMLGRRGGDLSGGQQQQLAIARALIMKPRLLVLDEPTEGIQPSIIKDIGRIIDLLRTRGGMAILLVEQYFDFARDLASRIVVMDRGDVVLNGTREELDEDDVRRRLSV